MELADFQMEYYKHLRPGPIGTPPGGWEMSLTIGDITISSKGGHWYLAAAELLTQLGFPREYLDELEVEHLVTSQETAEKFVGNCLAPLRIALSRPRRSNRHQIRVAGYLNGRHRKEGAKAGTKLAALQGAIARLFGGRPILRTEGAA